MPGTECQSHIARTSCSWFVSILIAAAIAFPWLGWAGLASSEGHRAVPAWTMLKSGDWVHPQLFEQAYLRKPPGMPWAIATSSWFFGTTEFAARLPSALGFVGMASVAWWFARRWFGPRWAPLAGAAQALMPALWPWARSAEIELLNAFAAQAAMLLTADIALARTRAAGRALMLGLALAVLAALKGPAGLPAFAGVVLGIALGSGFRAVLAPALWGGVLLGLGIVAPAATAWWRANSGSSAVTQGADEFLWSTGRLGGIALLPLAACAAALPGTLGLLFAWPAWLRRSARSDGAAPTDAIDADRAARVLSAGFLTAILISVLAGISNHRYTIPAFGLLPPLLAFGAARVFGRERGQPPTPDPIGRAIFLGHPARLTALLLIVAAIWVPLLERSRERNSGRAAGRELAAEITSRLQPAAAPGKPSSPTTELRSVIGVARAVVFADAAIDARPDVAWYLTQAEPRARVLWTPGKLRSDLVPPGAFVLARGDDAANELDRLRANWGNHLGSPTVLADLTVSGYRLVLLRSKNLEILGRAAPTDEGSSAIVPARTDSDAAAGPACLPASKQQNFENHLLGR